MRTWIRMILSTALLLMFSQQRLSAQFVLSGDDPARLRWRQAEWPHYRIVFPQGLDSLANVYGNLLEQYRLPVSRSTGLLAGAGYRRPTPVVLHAYNGVSNAMVAWAPKRMEFYTLAMPYETEALSWEKNLAIHEGRHLSQMMLGYAGWFKPFRWLTGDMLPIGVSGLFSPAFILEGDAVVAETALTDLGRGRDADFLSYYHSAFDKGLVRNWSAWRYGSWRRMTPDHYAFGYLAIAGTRAFYDDPLFMQNMYSRISRNPIRIASVRKEIKHASGMKFKPAWNGIVDGFQRIWDENAQARAPFISSEYVTPVPLWYEDHAHGTFVHDKLFMVRDGLVRPPMLSRIEDDGSITTIRPFSGSTSDLYYDPELDRIYWSETYTDPRWTHYANSRIKYYDLSSDKPFKARSLTREGRLYNPVASPDGKYIAAVDYPNTGGTALVVIDASSGEELRRMDAPAGMQMVMTSWSPVPDPLKDMPDVAVTAVVDEGMGIYLADLDSGCLSELLAPAKTKIGGLGIAGTSYIFTSDRTGVNEIYELRGRDVYQLTSTRYGASDAFVERDTLWYVTMETGIPAGKRPVKYGEGTLLHKTAVSGLLNRKVVFSDVYKDPVAEKLSEQESDLRSGTMILGGELSDYVPVPELSPESRPYRKLPHIPRFHSWIPFEVRYDNFSELNLDEIVESAGIGATGWFQNDLGTANGFVSYGYNLNPIVRDGAWRNVHSGHIKLTYTGLYPAFELTANVGSRPAYNYSREVGLLTEETSISRVVGMYSDRPSFNTSLRVYLPLKFNSDGWLRGITPQISYSFSNDLYRKGQVIYDYSSSLGGDHVLSYPEFQGISSTRTFYLQNISASLTGYIMQPTPSSLVYPKKGIGMQLGYFQRIGLSDLYSTAVYGYLYGYLPGLGRTHGLKLTATMQHTFDASNTESRVAMAPRGLSENPDMDLVLNSSEGTQLKLTADYPMQFALPERQWLPDVFHFTHMVVSPHVDALAFPYWTGGCIIRPGLLCTVGADVSAHTMNFFWFPAPVRLGFSFDYNCGPTLDHLISEGFDLSHFHLGLIFSIDI